MVLSEHCQKDVRLMSNHRMNESPMKKKQQRTAERVWEWQDAKWENAGIVFEMRFPLGHEITDDTGISLEMWFSVRLHSPTKMSNNWIMLCLTISFAFMSCTRFDVFFFSHSLARSLAVVVTHCLAVGFVLSHDKKKKNPICLENKVKWKWNHHWIDINVCLTRVGKMATHAPINIVSNETNKSQTKSNHMRKINKENNKSAGMLIVSV